MSRATRIVVSMLAMLPVCALLAPRPAAGAVTVSFDNNTASNPFRTSVSNNSTSFGGAVTDPAYNGGAATTLTFANPRTGVGITTPTSPNFATATTSFFGAESTGFGVGNASLGRFERGEAFTLTTTHALNLDSFVFHEWHGDEDLHLSWTEGGVAQSAVFDMTGETGSILSNATVLLSGVTADANSSIVMTNVSPSTANSSGRLRIRKMTVSLVPEPASVSLLAAGALLVLRGRRA